MSAIGPQSQNADIVKLGEVGLKRDYLPRFVKYNAVSLDVRVSVLRRRTDDDATDIHVGRLLKRKKDTSSNCIG